MTTSSSDSERPLWYCLQSSATSLLCCIISLAIWNREHQKRQKSDHLVASRYLSVSSYVCIVMGPIAGFLRSVWYIPVLCIISDVLLPVAAFLQLASMECYQLSRLYYCFSKNKVHSNKGYPNWVFVVLFSLTVMWLFSLICDSYFRITTECRIHSDGTVIIKRIVLIENWIISLIPSVLILLIELTTASLYWYKVRSLRRSEFIKEQKDRAVYDRIQSILHRVLILTFFYYIIAFIVYVLDTPVVRVAFVYRVLDYSFVNLFISYSMFLMQDHNTSEYVAFLRFVRRYKCIWCFCCFGYMVNEQFRMLVENVDTRKFEKEESIQTANTRNISADVEYGRKGTGMELSMATRTVNVASTVVEAETKNPEDQVVE